MAANRLHAYCGWQYTEDGKLMRRCWFVASTAMRLPIARELFGPTPAVRAAKEYRGPLTRGTIAVGRWQPTIGLDDL